MTTFTNPFAAPAAASGGLHLEDYLGRLLIVEPTGVEDGISTAFGPSSAVRATVTVVDAPTGPDVHEDALIFPKVLQSQLKPRIGQMVLGRLSKGNAKPGQSAPWIIQEPTEADIQAGVAYLNQRQAASLTQAASPKAPF